MMKTKKHKHFFIPISYYKKREYTPTTTTAYAPNLICSICGEKAFYPGEYERKIDRPSNSISVLVILIILDTAISIALLSLISK